MIWTTTYGYGSSNILIWTTTKIIGKYEQDKTGDYISGSVTTIYEIDSQHQNFFGIISIGNQSLCGFSKVRFVENNDLKCTVEKKRF